MRNSSRRKRRSTSSEWSTPYLETDELKSYVFGYLNEYALMRWRELSKVECSAATARFEQVFQKLMKNCKTLTRYQCDTLYRISSPTILHWKTMIQRECAICKQPYRGHICKVFGVPAHAACVKNSTCNIYYLSLQYVNTQHLLNTIPSLQMDGYSRPSQQNYSYTVVWNASNQLVPFEWTVEYYMLRYAPIIELRRQVIQHQALLRRRETYRRYAELQRQREAQWRQEFELSGGTTYLLARRTVPRFLHRFLRGLDPALAAYSAGVLAEYGYCGVIPESTWEIILQEYQADPLLTAAACGAAVRLPYQWHSSVINHSSSVESLTAWSQFAHGLSQTEKLLRFTFAQGVARAQAELACFREKGLYPHAGRCACSNKCALECPNHMCRTCCVGCDRHAVN